MKNNFILFISIIIITSQMTRADTLNFQNNIDSLSKIADSITTLIDSNIKVLDSLVHASYTSQIKDYYDKRRALQLSLQSYKTERLKTKTSMDSISGILHSIKRTQDSTKVREFINSALKNKSYTSITLLLKKLKPLLLKPKTEFETTPEYINRVDSFLKVMNVDMVIFHPTTRITYDADAESFNIYVDKPFSSTSRIIRTYTGQTAMGVKFKVTDLAEEDTLLNDFMGSSFMYNMSRDSAKLVKSSLDVAIIGKIVASSDCVIEVNTSTSRASLSEPYNKLRREHILSVSNFKIILFNKKTLELYEIQ
ncbi:MAG: hypothetical protein JNL74_05835 [Fibrobacteres bacterium]|nr:hypothetical protein [Fibrobacterota bacterium]